MNSKGIDPIVVFQQEGVSKYSIEHMTNGSVGFRQLVEEHGWVETLETAKSIFVPPEVYDPLDDKILLSLFGLAQYTGIDYNLWTLLDRIDIDAKWDSVIAKLDINLSKIFVKQIRSKGPTLFFDMESIKTSTLAIHFEEIVLRRKKEIEETEVGFYKNSNRLKLEALYKTAYGHKILTHFQFSKPSNREIFRTAEALGTKFQISESRRPKTSIKMSRRMQKHLRHAPVDYSLSSIATAYVYDNVTPDGVTHKEIMNGLRASYRSKEEIEQAIGNGRFSIPFDRIYRDEPYIEGNIDNRYFPEECCRYRDRFRRPVKKTSGRGYRAGEGGPDIRFRPTRGIDPINDAQHIFYDFAYLNSEF